jgi:hypothetical protein
MKYKLPILILLACINYNAQAYDYVCKASLLVNGVYTPFVSYAWVNGSNPCPMPEGHMGMGGGPLIDIRGQQTIDTWDRNRHRHVPTDPDCIISRVPLLN